MYKAHDMYVYDVLAQNYKKIYKMAYVPRSWVPWSGNGSTHDL